MTNHGAWISAGRAATCSLAIALLVAGCRHGGAKPTASAAPVLTVAVQAAAPRVLDTTLAVTGAIAAWQALPVSPAANGLAVVEVLADEGQHVHKGQVLARLDDRTLRAQLEDANARLASAQASLAKTRNPSRPQDISTDVAAVAQAQAALADARSSYNAYKELKAEGAVTTAELSAKAAALAAAQAQLQTARDRLTLARIGSRSEDIHIAEATVAQARAARDQLQVQLSQTHVVAPADGLVLQKSVLLGDVAAVGKPMFTLARDNRLEMDGNVAEPDLPRVHPGQSARVRSDALPGLVVTGHVREISPQLNATSRQALVRIDLPPDSGFKVGMFATGVLTLGRQSMLAVPADALINREGRNQIFVVNGNVAHARDVRTGESADGWVAVTNGLAPGEQVVIQGTGFLKDGDVVAIGSPVPTESPLAPMGDTSPPAGPSPSPAGGTPR